MNSTTTPLRTPPADPARAAPRDLRRLWRVHGTRVPLGLPADPRNLLRTTTLASRNAGLPHVGVHTLRHTYATIALFHGVPIHVVSRNLGHSSIAITADVYGHLTDEASQSAARTVSDALGF